MTNEEAAAFAKSLIGKERDEAIAEVRKELNDNDGLNALALTLGLLQRLHNMGIVDREVVSTDAQKIKAEMHRVSLEALFGPLSESERAW